MASSKLLLLNRQIKTLFLPSGSLYVGNGVTNISPNQLANPTMSHENEAFTDKRIWVYFKLQITN